jgi:dephospho-CoA kinase
MNKIVALVGMCGAGKSIVADYFRELGWTYVYFGGATMDELKRRGLEVNEVNEKMVREELRRVHGMGAFALLKLPEIEAGLAAGNVIADGLYSWTEYKVLKDKFGDNLLLLAVHTSRQLRYQRLAARAVRPLSPETAQARDYAEIENLEKGGPIAMADILLINDGTVEELIEQLKKRSW